jgi:Protein of unknown function (DUF992)
MKKLLLSLFATGSLIAAVVPASADIRVGVLRCDVAPGVGYIIASSKELRCAFHGQGQPRDVYRGYITRVGLDVGWTTGGRIGWWVFAPSRPGPGALEGGYYGASAEATVVAGVGANALVGGLNNSITLQPFSVAAQGGLDAALTVSGMRLDSIRSEPRRKRRARRG